MEREEKEKIKTAVLAKCKENHFDLQLSIEALSSLNEEDLEHRDNVAINEYLAEEELTGNIGYGDDKTKTIDEVIELFQKLKEDGFTKVGPTYYYGDFDGLYVEKYGRETDEMVVKRVFDLVCEQYKKLKKTKAEREQKQRQIDKLMEEIDSIKKTM